MRAEVLPKNILMIGPTGVGRSRDFEKRLARLAGAPFLKIEATKFTEVGYVGRDVEQIIRDLVEIAITQTRRAPSARMCWRARSSPPKTAWSMRCVGGENSIRPPRNPSAAS